MQLTDSKEAHILLLALAAAIATPAAVTVPATGPALTAEIRTRDTEFFELFFTGCDPARLATMLAPDFEMYHDRDGLVAKSAVPFIAQYGKSCAGRTLPDTWHSRRALVPGSLHVEAIPGYGAIEEGDHDFYEWKGNGPEHKAGSAHFVQLWVKGADGWRLSRVFSYAHRAARPSGEKGG
ncbi:MAG: nuclear transport factor 2 family protein [Pseudomonadota bacterium]|jgi:hypothetical protein|uniref:DUF4440 domain-containing protein n=1 Tax=hydrothermal vent metagenome TaxID=652676 RepID=A0A161K4Z9_9ZZZZ